MSSDLEELVSFISHGNTQIRQSGMLAVYIPVLLDFIAELELALELLVPYSCKEPNIFKTDQLLPVKRLAFLVRDYKQISKNALTILMNLSQDSEVQKLLTCNDDFLQTLFKQLANPNEPNIAEITMLLSNLSKNDKFKRKFLNQNLVSKPYLSAGKPIDFILDIFVKGTIDSKDQVSNYDYLSYVFSDLAILPEIRKHLLTPQSYDQIIPFSKLIVFTSHESRIRRLGVAGAIKNVCFEVESHQILLDTSENGLRLLPYLLLPLMDGEEYDTYDSEGMLEECQLLPDSKKREDDPMILSLHLESLLLLTSTRAGRDQLRKIRVYPIIRQLHLAIESHCVKDICDRLVNVLMRDEEDTKEESGNKSAIVNLVEHLPDKDDEDKILDV
ncbi:hypothetical protein HI914_04366 [Erysiphe necator]|nr:hypothetical protein HI914_04366 [Erysiphe necator]